MDSSARLLRLLSLLQTPRDWTGMELAERLEVSTRTVRNDIERLRSLGYPVHATRGAIGGYRLEAGAAMPPLLLDDDEAIAVAVGLRTAAGGAVGGIEETSLRALSKLEQVMPSRLRRKVNALQTFTVLVPRDERESTVDPNVLTMLAAACRDHDRIRFTYHDRERVRSRREVEPYRLVNWGRRWYLVAWDVERADWRTFRVDRLTVRLPLGQRFSPRPLPEDDVAAFVARGIAESAWRYRARVVVHASAETMADRIGRWVGTIEPIDVDTCVVDMGADTVETLAVYLGMLGADFDVDRDGELAVQLGRLAERYRAAVSA
ncbi:MAG TPA: WYL domain-containing protein [Candidatus Limnocylindrales bacterium]|nr:WYL domain-containing protein [Candidatus Limnocylindrales bacterium]